MNIKKIYETIRNIRTDLREYPAYRIFERALRIGVYGALVTAGTLLIGQPALTYPILKATLFASFVAGLDKFKNEMRKK